MLSPEAPYPLHSGGAYRTASLLHYFSRIASADLIYISDTGRLALLPPALVRSQVAIPLPRNRRDFVSRYTRNAVRAARGVPPLIDRLSGLGPKILEAIGGRRYDLGVIDHFWCAPYLPEISSACSRTLLNLHNVESLLHQRCAAGSSPFIRVGHWRFSRASRALEASLLPRFDAVLAPSRQDVDQVRSIAPDTNAIAYPNAIPYREMPARAPENRIVFSGNFEYHPNIDAVAFLVREIWPPIRRAHADVRLHLVGRGDSRIRHLIRHDSRIDTTGEIENAPDEIASAQVVIAPLRAGSGTRIKILEAWAAGRAVVATSIAAEGLEARHGENCIIADSPAEFSASVVRLLASQQERNRIAERGRRTFEHSYTWPAAWKILDNSLQLKEFINA